MATPITAAINGPHASFAAAVTLALYAGGVMLPTTGLPGYGRSAMQSPKSFDGAVVMNVKSGIRRWCIGLGAACTMAATPAAAEIIEGYPDVVVCRSQDARTAVYLHQVRDDGSAVYMTLGEGFATVSPDGIFSREGAKDCDGKTLEQLEKDGQAHTFGE
ncbi:MAG: hypothetical protein GY798_16340 [Hyphomicrobiales bacterium]|nr:hypothetical protein [Hyphomicrobiales bacterium]